MRKIKHFVVQRVQSFYIITALFVLNTQCQDTDIPSKYINWMYIWFKSPDSLALFPLSGDISYEVPIDMLPEATPKQDLVSLNDITGRSEHSPYVCIFHAHNDVVVVVEEGAVEVNDVLRMTTVHNLKLSNNSLAHFSLGLNVNDLGCC